MDLGREVGFRGRLGFQADAGRFSSFYDAGMFCIAQKMGKFWSYRVRRSTYKAAQG